MNITLMMAISLDGHITDSDDSSDWTRDDLEWEKTTKDFGAVAIGHTTFKLIKDIMFDEVTYFVLTNTPDESTDKIIYCGSPEEIVKKAEGKGISKLLLSGGGETNLSFAKLGLIDEMLISLHPFLLQSGKNLFGHEGVKMQLEMLGHKDLDRGLIQVHYKVLK